MLWIDKDVGFETASHAGMYGMMDSLVGDSCLQRFIKNSRCGQAYAGMTCIK